MKAYTVSGTLFALALPLSLAKEKISLRWAICEPTPQHALTKLGLHEATSPYKENPITYYDEQPPIHIQSGLMLRTKTNKGQPVSTVKVRFDEETSDVPGFVECGWSRYGNNPPRYTCEKRCPLASTLPQDIWCREQVQFVQAHRDVDWVALAPYGPYQNAKWKMQIGGHKAKFDDVVAGDLHLMEIETKVPKAEAEKAAEAITRFLQEREIVLCEPQEGKTMRLFRTMGYNLGDKAEL